MVKRCEDLIEADNVLFKNSKIFPKCLLAPFHLFLDPKLDRLSLQQLEFEMDSTGYPDDYNFFELGYCGRTQFPYPNIFLDQANDFILSRFQEEDHLFISEALRDENIHLVALYYVYKLKTDTSRTKIRMMMKTTPKYKKSFGCRFHHQKTTKKFHCYHFLSGMILSFCL